MASRVGSRRGNDPVRSELRELDVRPQRSRGQNFLTDHEVIGEILTFAGIPEGSPVVEVGPGLGALTFELARGYPELAVIEIESEFAARLKSTLPPHCRVIEADMRDVHVSDLFSQPAAVLSNVPYSISTDFVMWLFRERASISIASLLLQKEFAERLAASEGSRDYGSLSVFRALYASAELGPVIKPEAFHPKPKVDSQLVRLDFSSPVIRLDGLSEETFQHFVRACFSKKRKTLLNSLSASDLFEEKDAARSFLKSAQVGESVRAEEIPPGDFVRLATLYHSGKKERGA